MRGARVSASSGRAQRSGLYKLGIITDLPEEPVTPLNWNPRDAIEAQWQHANVYERTTAGPKPVLVAGVRTGHLRLLRTLMEAWEPPFWILYVLTVPRALGDTGAGRYASDSPVPSGAVEHLISTYGEFLEHDARHQLWITADSDRSSPLVYDQRNRIYAYGPLEHHAAICSAAGLSEGPVVIPPGLVRHYHDEFDTTRSASSEGTGWPGLGRRAPFSLWTMTDDMRR